MKINELRCKECGCILPASDFTPVKRSSTGFRSCCKRCYAAKERRRERLKRIEAVSRTLVGTQLPGFQGVVVSKYTSRLLDQVLMPTSSGYWHKGEKRHLDGPDDFLRVLIQVLDAEVVRPIERKLARDRKASS